jgi:hypothetical protein
LTACSLTAQSDLARNREKWRQAGLSHYRYTLFIGCFCPFGDKLPLTVEVRDGDAVAMTYSDGTQIEPGDPSNEFFSRYATIDRIFAELEADLGGRADEVTASYDPAYGYPAQVDIDHIKEATDDEMGLTVAGIEILP